MKLNRAKDALSYNLVDVAGAQVRSLVASVVAAFFKRAKETNFCHIAASLKSCRISARRGLFLGLLLEPCA